MSYADLKILFVVDAIQGRNGVGTYFQDLATQLKPHVRQVELVAPNLQHAHPVQGFSIPLPGDSTQRLFQPKLRKLTHLALNMKPDVIIVPGPGLFSLAGLWLAHKLGVPVCMTHQTDYPSLVKLYWGGPHGYLAYALLAWANRFMITRSSSVVAISESMLTQLSEQGARQAHLVGTSLSNDLETKAITEPRNQINKVLFLGRLAAEKNIEHFLELAQLRPDLEFTIAGDGPLRDVVIAEQKRLQNLNFLGWQQRENIPSLLDNHDLLILPSSVEAFGTVALEAMARARLVLTSATCGINEWKVLAPGLFIIEPNESLPLALSRLEALTAEERRKIAMQGRQAALALNQTSLEQWLQILKLTANKAHLLPKSKPSPIFALLRRLASA